ncbi:MAG: HEAT repeat domain-containing protein, partial [Planctomycetes bacterium]|nr:HEAT repeat domain-containing protein [Planctomycetota bacterium]
VELTGGYPQMMDPNYARRILSLGKDGLPAVIGCAKSSHLFLKRNAVAALANYHDKAAYKELRKYIKHKDLVVRLRAMKGLMNTKSKENISYFKNMLSSKDPMFRSIGCYGLGSYGDKDVCGKLMTYFNFALKSNNKDFMWSLLPAIRRCDDAESSKRDSWVDILRSAAKRFKRSFPSRSSGDAGGEVPSPQDPKRPNVTILGQRAAYPEKIGYKNIILWQMTQLALAALNSELEINRVLSLLKSGGVGQAFHKVNWFLVPDALGNIPGGKGVDALKSIAQDAAIPESISVWAVRALERLEVEAKWFYDIVVSYGRSTVRAQALIALSQKSGSMAKEACQKAIENFNSAPSNGAEAFFYTSVLHIGGQLSAFKSEKLLEVTRACFSARAYAKRQGNNDPDITKSNISVYPPLLETAILELGRTGDEKAIDLFMDILKADMPNGSPEAALALGVHLKPEVIQTLIATLRDCSQGWTRFCAYRALKNLSDKDYFCDWIFGSKSVRERRLSGYEDWLKELKLPK